jgi:hypothetical protein
MSLARITPTLQQFLSEDPPVLLNVSVDIENAHVPKILIFNNI